MKKSSVKWGVGLSSAALFFAFGTYGKNLNSAENSIAPSEPVISAKIGDSWTEVIKYSTLELGPLPTPAGTIINRPHTFFYSDPRHPMRLDDVGYTGIAFAYQTGRIVDFGIGLYRESAGAEETWRRLNAVAEKMQDAGWISDAERNSRSHNSSSPSELKERYLKLPGGAKGVEQFWHDNSGNEAWVALIKTITGEPAAEESRFNIILQIQVATNPKK